VSRLLRTAYQLRYHVLAGWALDRWLATLAFAAALAVLLSDLQHVGWPARLFGAVLLLAGLALLVLRRWAAVRMYVVFMSDRALPAPSAEALDPTDKISLQVTGEFEVEGKRHFFAHLLAYWRTFATGEHAVMAIRRPSRYLLVGAAPGEDLGMWYIFIRPAMVVSVTAGELVWGRLRRPALEVCYQPASAEKPSGWRRLLRLRTPQSKRRAVYLAFEEQPSLLRVWADLLAN
jgi:hypothetical protein